MQTHRLTYKVGVLFAAVVLLACSLQACSSTKRLPKSPERREVTLSPEEQRRYEYYFLEAIWLKQSEQHDAAFEMLNHCLSICPDAPSALFQISSYYLYLNQKEKAIEALTRAVELEPDNFWYKQTLASFYQTNREYEKAIAVYEGMLEQFPTCSAALLSMLVNLYNTTQNYEKVIHSLDRLEQLEGKSEQISMEKFRIYLTSGNSDAAFKEIENLSAEYPEDTRYRLILGDVYLNYDRTEEAGTIYRQVLQEEPSNNFAKLSMASYYHKTGQDSSYRALLDTLLVQSSIDSDTKVGMMRQIIAEHQDEKDSTFVWQLFERMMEQKQTDAKMGTLCVQYMLSKQRNESEVSKILKKILEVEPDNIPARVQLLMYATRRQDLEEIIALCSAGAEYAPEELSFYYYWGIALYQQEEKEKALEIYEKAVRQKTTEANAQLVSDLFSSMGDIYYQLGEKEKVYACYDSALVYYPTHVGALNNYAYYLSEEGKQLDKAEEMSYKTIKAEPTNSTYLDTYAWILFMKKDYVQARVYIEEALKADTTTSDVLLEHAGDIYQELGEPEKALRYWESAFEVQKKAQAVEDRLRRKIEKNKKSKP